MKKVVAEVRRRSMLIILLGVGLSVTESGVFAIGLDHDLRFQRVLEGSEAITKNASALTSITQDQTGFMWFGGENGLARFDGAQFKRYEQDDRRGGLPSNHVRDLTTDKQGVLWVATDRGLCRYLPQTDSFEVFKPSHSTTSSLPHNVVTSIAVDRRNNLILGTGSGISILQSDRQSFTNHPLTLDKKSVIFVLDTFVDSKNRIWVGTRDAGLFLLSSNGDLIRHFLADQNDVSALQSDTIKAIEEDQFGRIWVGTYGGGVSRIKEGERGFINYRYDPQQEGAIGSNTIWDIYLDSHGELWISTDQGGLALYQQVSDSFIHFRASIHDRFTLSSNQVRTIFEDRDHNLWIATFPNGISFFDRAHSQVTNYTHKYNDPNSLTNSAVLDFLQTSDGILWIGTEDGLNQFDIDRQEFIGRYNREPNIDNGLTASSVLSLAEDYNGEIWVGTWSGGLHRLNRITQKFTHYSPNKGAERHINSAFIWHIYLDSHNTLWVGTENGGLSRYDRRSDRFTAFTHDQADPQSIASNFVWSILEDSRGQLWIATADGLDIMDRESGTFRHFVKQAGNPATIDSVRMRSLFEDRNGYVWIGTQDKGAYVYSPHTETFTHVNWPDSLSPLVASFIEDNLGFIWASTSNGIARIEPQTLEVRSFHKSHGLIGDNYNRDATFKDRKGQLYFGGTEGFSVFDPRVFSRADIDYPLVLTDFKLFNRSVTPAAVGSPLQYAISYGEEIRLQHDHSMFSFNFAVLNYHSPFEHRYAYKLEGFDSLWHEVGNNHTATYTNIAPGDYIFRVKSFDRDGGWNHNITQVKLNIAPSIWRSNLAMGSYLLVSVLVIGILVRAVSKYMESNRRQALIREVDRINKVKDTVMVNSAHELHEPIRSMVDLADAILREQAGCLPAETEQRLALISRHGNCLYGLIEAILDYGKSLEHKLELNIEPTNIFEQTQSCLQLLQPLLIGRPVELVNAIEPGCPHVASDPKHLRQIIISTLYEMIKHTEKGEVYISAIAAHGSLSVEISSSMCRTGASMRRNLTAPSADTNADQQLTVGNAWRVVTKQLVELHGGTIDFDAYVEPQATAKEPTGRHFRFTLPLADQQPPTPLQPLEKPVKTEQALAPVVAQGGPSVKAKGIGELAPPVNAEQWRILIVDDDPINRMVLNGILSLHNYTVLEAGSGPEALSMVLQQTQIIDLIILDVMMPRMSGFEVCTRLRQTYQQEALPIVFLTAKYGEDDVRKGLQVGGNEVLHKPVSKEELLPRVKAYLLALTRYREGH